MPKFNFNNAVLYKDMMVRAKRSNMAVLIFISNIILSIVSLSILIAINGSLAAYSSPASGLLPWFFIGVIIAESALVCLVLPSATATAISGERERQTLDVLLTTNMTPFEIIIGKYLSCLMYVALLLISTLPMVSIVFVYGSISFLQILALYGSILVVAMYLASFGIFFSTVCKKSSSATIMSFLTIGLMIFGTIILVAICAVAVELRNELYYHQIHVLRTMKEFSYDPFFAILYFNPAATVVDVVGHLVGFNFSTRVFGGMNYIISDMSNNLRPGSFMLKYWALISIVVQLTATYLILLASAKHLDPGKQRKTRGRKK